MADMFNNIVAPLLAQCAGAGTKDPLVDLKSAVDALSSQLATIIATFP